MKKVIVSVAFLAAAVAAFALGRITRSLEEAVRIPESDDAYQPKKAAPVDPTNALKAQIASLKKKIAALESEKQDALPEAGAVAEPIAEEALKKPVAENARPASGPFASLAELKKNDPERYAEVSNRMARFESRRLRRAQTRLDTLSQLNTDGFTKEQKQTHEQLQDLLVRREELGAKIRETMEDENVTEADRRAAFDEMRTLHENIRRLERQERNTLLTTTAQNLGLSGEDAAELADAVEVIYDMTGMGEHGPHGPGPGIAPPR